MGSKYQVDSVWTKLDAVGSGLRGQPGNMGHAAGYRAMPARPATADILYSYTKTGQVQKMDYPPVGAYTLYAYNPRLWLDSMIVFGPVNGGMLTTKLFTEALRYDSSGQIIQQQSEHYGSARRTVDYGYDKANRLTVWGSGDDTTTYSYDAVGNRTDQFVWGGGAIQTSTNHAIGGLGPNQLTSLQKYTGGGTPNERAGRSPSWSGRPSPFADLGASTSRAHSMISTRIDETPAAERICRT